MLFPTIRFAIFFMLVLPASWFLMPVAGRRGRATAARAQPWLVPMGLLGGALLLGPLAPDWPTAVSVLGWLTALVLAGWGAQRLLALRGLTRWSVFMLVASYVFYGNYDWRYVALLAASTVANQVLAGAIHRSDAERSRRAWLGVAVAANLGVLAWFKYKGFFIESASSILAPLGIDISPPARSVIPPVGISFFTFQALSYVIDVHRRRLRPTSLLDFAVYLAFFPSLVAGPIVRASEFLPQLRRPRDARRVDTGLAFWLIGVGLFKKVVVSSYLAEAIVDPVFRLPAQHEAVDTLLAVYGYAIQIYCDFSGYTDIAIGLALLLGFRFPQNFDAPYTAASLQDFWRRWHMTLSRWLRDYLYIPLGGNQRGPTRAYLNLFLTMLIGGLWHGAAWTFVVWGGLHGAYLAGERWLASRPRADAPGAPSPVGPDGGSSGQDPDPPDDRVEVPVGRMARAAELGPPPVAGPSGGEVARRDDLDLTSEAGPVAPVRRPMSPTTRRWLGRVLTFHVVCLGWVFFRAPTLTEAFAVLGRFTHLGTGSGVNWVVVGTIAVFLATQFVPNEPVGRVQAALSRLAPWQLGLLLALWLMFTNALSPTGVAPFIYFAF